MQINHYYILFKDKIIIDNDRFSQYIQEYNSHFTWETDNWFLKRIFDNESFFNENNLIYQGKILWISKEISNYEILYI